MKIKLAIFLLLATCACTHEPGKPELAWTEFVDSTDVSISHYQETSDTSYICDAIAYCDAILHDSLTKEHRYSALLKKTSFLGMLGRFSEAFETRGESVCLLDSAAIERLEYMSLKCRVDGDSIGADNYLVKAIHECANYPDDADVILKKSCFLILLGKNAKAKDELETFLRSHDNQVLEMALEDFDSFVSQTKDGVRILTEQINQGINK